MHHTQSLARDNAKMSPEAFDKWERHGLTSRERSNLQAWRELIPAVESNQEDMTTEQQMRTWLGVNYSMIRCGPLWRQTIRITHGTSGKHMRVVKIVTLLVQANVKIPDEVLSNKLFQRRAETTAPKRIPVKTQDLRILENIDTTAEPAYTEFEERLRETLDRSMGP